MVRGRVWEGAAAAAVLSVAAEANKCGEQPLSFGGRASVLGKSSFAERSVGTPINSDGADASVSGGERTGRSCNVAAVGDGFIKDGVSASRAVILATDTSEEKGAVAPVASSLPVTGTETTVTTASRNVGADAPATGVTAKKPLPPRLSQPISTLSSEILFL